MELVIFDIDGTLVDSVDLHAQAWKEALAHFGKDVEFQALRRQIGKGGNELLPEFLTRTEIEKFGDQLKDYRGELFKEKFIDQVKPFPYVRELMARIDAHSKKVAVGSSAHKDEVDHYVKLLNVEDLVDVKTSADDVERAKPHPDIFQVVLEKAKVRANQALVVGDSPFDAQAAKRAHIAAIGFLCGGFERQSLIDAGASEIYSGPRDLFDRYSKSAIA